MDCDWCCCACVSSWTESRQVVQLGRTRFGQVLATRWRIFWIALCICISAEPVRDLPWLSQPKVDDEWSGLSKDNITSYSQQVTLIGLHSFFYMYICNGFCVCEDGGSADPSSDWNAPAEVWGNYEDPTVEPPLTPSQSLPETAKVNLLIAAAVSVPQLQATQSCRPLFFFCSFFLFLFL